MRLKLALILTLLTGSLCSLGAFPTPTRAAIIDFPNLSDGTALEQSDYNTSEATITLRSLASGFGNVATGSGLLSMWSTGYGDLTGIAWNPAPTENAEIKITANELGKRVQLLDFKLGGWQQDEFGEWKIFDSEWNLLNEGAGLHSGSSHTDVILASTYSDTGGIVLQWSRAWFVGIDEIEYTVSDISVSAVPLPGAFYMLIAAICTLIAATKVRG